VQSAPLQLARESEGRRRGAAGAGVHPLHDAPRHSHERERTLEEGGLTVCRTAEAARFLLALKGEVSAR
jgi:hypothetical protein